MNRLILGVVAAGVALASTAPARAEVRIGVVIGHDHPGYRKQEGGRNRYDTGRIGFDNGYRDGLRAGEKDDRHDDRYNYRDEGRYRDGDSGYRREYGPRYEYVSAYRHGFAEGYRWGYSNRQTYRRYGRRSEGQGWRRY
jgi:hypothetical protein